MDIQSSVRPQIFRLLCYYALGVFAGAILIAYPVYSLLGFVGVEGVRFEKVAMRCLKLLAVLGVWPLMRVLALNTANAWGYSGPVGHFTKQLFIGLGAGLVSLLVVALVLVSLGVRVPDPEFVWSAPVVLAITASAALSAFATALVEETWFRGALHGAIAHGRGVYWAVGFTAAAYAAVHFIRPRPVPMLPGTEAGWEDGLTVILGAFHRFADGTIVGPLCALAAAGVLLGLIRHNTGSLAACIGVHAGWVIAIKILRKSTDNNPDAPLGFLAAGYDGVIGYFAFAWFSLLAIAYYFRVSAMRSRTAT